MLLALRVIMTKVMAKRGNSDNRPLERNSQMTDILGEGLAIHQWSCISILVETFGRRQKPVYESA